MIKNDPTMEKSFEITQKLSDENKGKNFICPCCSVTRVAKAKTGKGEEWNHTGCQCTYKWLEAHKKLIK